MLSLFDPIIHLFYFVLTALQAATTDWGAAVILLTLGVRFLLFFVNLRSARTQVLHQRMAPKLKELRLRYQNDSRAYTEAVMKLYQEFGFKPFSNVLGMLIQLPVFWSLYH